MWLRIFCQQVRCVCQFFNDRTQQFFRHFVVNFLFLFFPNDVLTGSVFEVKSSLSYTEGTQMTKPIQLLKWTE